jgi:hypothetical protein
MELAAYTLETLRTDGEFLLSRGRRHTDATPPSMLVVTPVAERPALGSLRRLEHEVALQAELDPGWAVRPLALTQDRGRSMVLLEDPGGEPLDLLLAEPMELRQVLRVAIGLSAALAQLHGRGLIHKEIKPANVFVNPSTGQVWLMGFGIASRLPRERQAPEPPEFIASTLPYMAPEQTGRMNRSVDSRSDLYALGVTLYEMLTGSLPFTASDPMEWVHCHIARRPVSPAERSREVPPVVSAIVTKLLAKPAEERYQTAAGVEADLRHCLSEWEESGSIEPFPLGAHDVPDVLRVPEKLYGRAQEVRSLLTAFERVVLSDTPVLVLVSGFSGIGKSSVVNELHKVIVPQRGLFVMKLQARVISGDYQAAMAARARATPLLWSNLGMIQEAEYHFYGALAVAAYYDEASTDERSRLLTALQAHHEQLEHWAQTCPENFQNRSTVVSAERARLEGRDLDAERLYEEAIRSARENGFVQNEALANELAGRFYLHHGIETSGYAYLGNARACYAVWGADGKVRQLDRLYPRLAASPGSAAVIGSSVQQLDVATVVKASQVVSSEIVLPRLIETRMTIALQNAGADRGLLILPREGAYRIEAEARARGDKVDVVLSQASIMDPSAPEALLRYVIRSQQSVILADASRPYLFSADPYLRREQCYTWHVNSRPSGCMF